MDNTADSLQLISLLLQYPDSRLFESVRQLEASFERMSSGRLKNGVKKFLENIQSQPPIRIQELYTAAFDLNPSTTLNMTYHRWGDGEKRSGALAQLQQIYLDAGYEKTTAELPDYLPLMLEFMAVCPEARSNDVFRECLKGLGSLVDRLRENASPYAELLQLIDGEAGGRIPASPSGTEEKSTADRQPLIQHSS